MRSLKALSSDARRRTARERQYSRRRGNTAAGSQRMANGCASPLPLCHIRSVGRFYVLSTLGGLFFPKGRQRTGLKSQVYSARLPELARKDESGCQTWRPGPHSSVRTKSRSSTSAESGDLACCRQLLDLAVPCRGGTGAVQRCSRSSTAEDAPPSGVARREIRKSNSKSPGAAVPSALSETPGRLSFQKEESGVFRYASVGPKKLQSRLLKKNRRPAFHRTVCALGFAFSFLSPSSECDNSSTSRFASS